MARPFEIVCDTSERIDWLSERVQGIGASEIAVVLGEAPEQWGSPLSLYAQKIGKYERNLDDVEAVYWGNKLEEAILSAYAERTGRRTKRERFLLRSVEHPWMLCTLDGRTWEPSNERFKWPFEIKNVSAYKAEEWIDGPPPHYYLQLQQQLAVTNEPKATIAALIGGQRMVWCDVPRDEIAIRRIIVNGARFWERVVNRDMPAPDGSESTRKALQALYPEGHGTVILPATAADCADELEHVKAELKRLEERKEFIENTVRAALGEAELGVLHDGRSFSWRKQKRRAFTAPESTFRVLRLHQSNR
jgi:putative phage-type endonuclease